MLPKPAIGAPCNGCGLCCQVRVCSTGSYLLGLVDSLGQRVDRPSMPSRAQLNGRAPAFQAGHVGSLPAPNNHSPERENNARRNS